MASSTVKWTLVLIAVLHKCRTTTVCPCGKTGENFTIGNDLVEDSNGAFCARFHYCQTCSENVNRCISCPVGRFGPLCLKEQSKTLMTFSSVRRQKRRIRDVGCSYWPETKLVNTECRTNSRERICTGTCVIGHHFQNMKEGEEIVLECRNGRWSPSHTFPPCESKGLCDIEMNGVGSFICNTGALGRTCNITCAHQGERTFSCVPGKNWNPTLPVCVRAINPSDVERTPVCKCKNGGRCDPMTGGCICSQQFRGDNCEYVKGHCELEMNGVGSYNCTIRHFRTTCDIRCASQGERTFSCETGKIWNPTLPSCVRTISPSDVERTPVCKCQNGGRCDQMTGRCLCSQQFRGEYCEYDMTPVCKCRNGGRCHPRTGRCTCTERFRGEFCQYAVTPVCKCQNGGRCDRWTRKCICTKQFRGDFCEHDMTPACNCQNGGTCNPTTGMCLCSEQFSGDLCEYDVTPVCKCQNGGKCHPTTGRCTCTEQYRGEFCQYVTTPVCKCQNGGRCNRWTGKCICTKQFRGDFCERDMTPACNCQNGGTCNPTTGQCLCSERFSGDLCEYDVTPVCKCQNGGSCSPWTGRCTCTEWFHGEFCEYDHHLEATKCDDPGQISNGYRRDNDQNFGVGSMVAYSCHRGFRLTGSNPLTCLDTGEWSDYAPVCSRSSPAVPVRPPPRKECTDPGDIEHGSKVTDATYLGTGSAITYNCKFGYSLKGNSELICNSDGTWSDEKPVCQKIDNQPVGNVEFCPVDASPMNTEVKLIFPSGAESAWSKELPRDKSKQEYSVGYKIRYRCRSNLFDFRGSEYQTCLSSGRWSGITPACIPTCGISNVPRTPFLVNGSPTNEGQWPWQAAIFVMDSGRRSNFTCAGSLVSDKWIVTAAHCVTEDSRSSKAIEARRISVHLGRYNLSLKEERNAQIKEVQRIVVHERYDYVRLDSDIALIELVSKVELTVSVKPICLPSDKSDVQPGKSGSVVGWGESSTRENSPSILLKEMEVTVVADRECEARKSGKRISISKNMFCAESQNKRSSSCSGDSGGPMMIQDQTITPSHWTLEGIVSWGNHQGCELSDDFTGFTKVSQFVDWILYRI